MAESAAERIAALRAKVAAERDKTRAQHASSSTLSHQPTTTTLDERSNARVADTTTSAATTSSDRGRERVGGAGSSTANVDARDDAPGRSTLSKEHDFETRGATPTEAEIERRIQDAVLAATAREQEKTASIIAAMAEANDADGDVGELKRRLLATTESLRAAEQLRGMDAARSATAMDTMASELEELRVENSKMNKELKKLRAHLLDLEDEEDENAEEQEREIDEAREEERREYERKLNEYKRNLSGNDEETAKLREIIRQRDEEVTNLQKALGAYYAEMESAESQRVEAASLRQKLAALTSQATADRAAAQEAKAKAENAENQLQTFEGHLKIAKEECIKATGDASKLRKALHHALQKSSDMMVESEKLLDKRIVSDLFIAYLEREQAEEVLDLLSRMLGFTEQQKRRMEMLKTRNKKRGVLGKIARAPVSIAAGAIGVALNVTGATGENKEVPIADLWLDFLEKNVADENKEPIPSSSELISAAGAL